MSVDLSRAKTDWRTAQPLAFMFVNGAVIDVMRMKYWGPEKIYELNAEAILQRGWEYATLTREEFEEKYGKFTRLLHDAASGNYTPETSEPQ